MGALGRPPLEDRSAQSLVGDALGLRTHVRAWGACPAGLSPCVPGPPALSGSRLVLLHPSFCLSLILVTRPLVRASAPLWMLLQREPVAASWPWCRLREAGGRWGLWPHVRNLAVGWLSSILSFFIR